MRSFETYLLVGCAVAVLWPALFGVRSRRGVVAGGLLLLAILQWQIEGFRWQLVPLYVVALGLAAGDVLAVERDLPWFRRIGRGVFGLVGLALVVSPAVILPVPRLPVPSGPLEIGTTTLVIRHAEVEEPFGPTPGGRRRFVAQVWYPAEVEDGAAFEPWIPDIDVVGPALSRRVGRPGFFFSQARYTLSHAVAGAAPVAGAHPVVIYSHHLGRFRHAALDQVEELVSQGYVVVAVDHTHAAVATVIDGEVIGVDEVAFDDPEATPEQAEETLATAIATFSADITAVIDEIEAGAGGAFGPLALTMDPAIVGVWGHGLGGGAALSACLVDERCDAVAGMDPLVEPLPNEVLAVTATRPMLLMRSDPWRGNINDAVLRGIVDRSTTLTYWVDVLGADSSDFIATSIVSPVADRLGMKGPIQGSRAMMINERYLTGFFDRFLLGTGSAALDTANFDEVDIELVDRRP